MTTVTDNRYGHFKYGEAKYGPPEPSERLLYALQIAWGGAFTGDNEADRMIGFRITRGRDKFVGSGGTNFEPVGTGRLSVTLDNADGRYDAWNAESPLYPNISFGKEIILMVKDGMTDTTYPLFRGWITNIETSGYGASATATIEAEDGAAWLTRRTARTGIYESISPENAIAAILTKVGWQWGAQLDTTSDIIRWWWSDTDKSAMANLEEIAQSVGGYFFIGADGKAYYRSRSYLGAVFDFRQEELLKDILIPQPWEYGFDAVRIVVHPRAKAALGVIYQLHGNAPLIRAGEKITIWAQYSYNNERCAATNVVTPVPTTDWKTNTAADGSGADKTAQCTLTMYDFGDTAKITVKNNSANDVYLNFLQIRGEAIYASSLQISKPDDDDGLNELTLDYPWMQDANVAIDLANIYQPFFAERHPFPTVQFEARPDKQFGFELFDVVSLSLPKFGIVGQSYRVGGIEHESLTENCQAVRTRVGLEPYYGNTAQYWTWDIQNFGVDTVFGW